MSAEHDPSGPSETRDLDQAEHSPLPSAASSPRATPFDGGDTSAPAVAVPPAGGEAAVRAVATPSVGGDAAAATASDAQAANPAEVRSAVDVDPASSGSTESAFDRRVDLEALETLEGDLALIEAGMSHLEADDLDAAEAAVEQLRSGEAPPTS